MKKLTRCLLVDDDIDDREIFLMALTEIGDQVRCRTAGNGIEALRVLHAEHAECPDYIFLDINMPKMGGLECLEEIRKSERFDQCRIFLYTTIDDPEIRKEGNRLNAGCIVKPAGMKQLRETLFDILGSTSES